MTDELKQWEYDRGYEKGEIDEIKKVTDKCKYLLASGEGKKKSLEHLISFLEEEKISICMKRS